MTAFCYALQVALPFGVHREVDTHLHAHLSRKATNRLGPLDDSLHRTGHARITPADAGIYEQPEPTTSNSVFKERILRQRSLQMRDQQKAWQVYIFPSLNFEVNPICHYSLSWHFEEFWPKSHS